MRDWTHSVRYRPAKWEEVENGFPAIVIHIYLRREGRIDASVGAGMTRDDCISAIHHAFAGDGKVAQSVDVVTWARVVGRSWVLRQAANAWTEVHRICKGQYKEANN
jgi:hypothetical protein